MFVEIVPNDQAKNAFDYKAVVRVHDVIVNLVLSQLPNTSIIPYNNLSTSLFSNANC